MAESIGVEGRGSFYESVGAIRDVLQNHLCRSSRCWRWNRRSGPSRRSCRTRSPRCWRRWSRSIRSRMVRGQYIGYREEPGVDPQSERRDVRRRPAEDRLVAVGRRAVVRPRRQGARRSVTEAVVELREPPQLLFDEAGGPAPERNLVRFRLGKRDGVTFALQAKTPGPHLDSQEVDISVDFAAALGERQEAYERLLNDAIDGSPRRFAREDIVERTWRIVQPALDDPGRSTRTSGRRGPDRGRPGPRRRQLVRTELTPPPNWAWTSPAADCGRAASRYRDAARPDRRIAAVTRPTPRPPSCCRCPTGPSLRGTYQVRLGDVDPRGLMRLDAIARFLQDVAADDAADSGLDPAYGWVVRRTLVAVAARRCSASGWTLTTFCTGTGRSWAERRTSIGGGRGAVGRGGQPVDPGRRSRPAGRRRSARSSTSATARLPAAGGSPAACRCPVPRPTRSRGRGPCGPPTSTSSTTSTTPATGRSSRRSSPARRSGARGGPGSSTSCRSPGDARRADASPSAGGGALARRWRSRAHRGPLARRRRRAVGVIGTVQRRHGTRR